MYVRDLELKSRYLEGECRRLGHLLQCCYAENQALRLSLHSGSAFGASATKQESAVLLLGMNHQPSCSCFFFFYCLYYYYFFLARGLSSLIANSERNIELPLETCHV